MVGAFFMPGEIWAFFMPIFTEGVSSDMVISPNVRADAATIGNPYLKRGYEEWL